MKDKEASGPQQDYYLFGHRHLPLCLSVGSATYINTGDWLKYDTFAVFDTKELRLMKWDKDQVVSYEN